MVYKIGSKGSVVRQIQQKVNCQITGVYNTATKRAVLNFQKQNNLKQDGDVNEAVLAVMFPPKVVKPKINVQKVAKPKKKTYSVEDTKKQKEDDTTRL